MPTISMYLIEQGGILNLRKNETNRKRLVTPLAISIIVVVTGI
jgi:hypothetical protein